MGPFMYVYVCTCILYSIHMFVVHGFIYDLNNILNILYDKYKYIYLIYLYVFTIIIDLENPD